MQNDLQYRQNELFRHEQLEQAEKRRLIREAQRDAYKPDHKDEPFRVHKLAR